MTLLDGKNLSQNIIKNIKTKTEDLSRKDISVGLAVLLVGEDPASHLYVKKKEEACKASGIYSIVHHMPNDISEQKVIETIKMMNENPNVNGILVQLPLPNHINESKVLEAIDPLKDVDGFHPYNIGRVSADLKSFVPCTPLGVMKLLKEYKINLEGLNVCIVGASNIVGKPLAALMLNANATVNVCHIYTKDLKSHTINADLIAVGVGKAGLITEDMVKSDAVVVDIGINKTSEGKIVGDVDFKNVAEKCSYITPVPGSVGPMTIAMLLQNTLQATLIQNNIED